MLILRPSILESDLEIDPLPLVFFLTRSLSRGSPLALPLFLSLSLSLLRWQRVTQRRPFLNDDECHRTLIGNLHLQLQFPPHREIAFTYAA